MSQVISFKCPSCGGYLVFDPVKQRFQCPYCGGSFAENELKEQSEQRQQAAEQARSAEPNSELRSYHCQMCGAEIVTDTTTAATRCYYCHSPVVLNDRLTDEFRPDGVIPFKLDKKAAEAEFKSFISKKRFVQPDFFSQAQMEDFPVSTIPTGRAIFPAKARLMAKAQTSLSATARRKPSPSRGFSPSTAKDS